MLGQRPASGVALALATTLAACTLALTSCARWSGADSEHAHGELISALRVPRRIGPRLSVETAYRPCKVVVASDTAIPVTRCNNSGNDTPSADVLALASRAAAEIQSSASPDALHTAALIDLAWSESGKSLGRSISYLHTAARLDEHSATDRSDLAAAYIVRAERTGEIRDLLDAIDQASRGVERMPRNTAARFNLALALDELGLPTEASRAWARYLALDSTSGWAMEARDHMRRLESATSPVSVVEHTGPSAPTGLAALAALAARDPQRARIMGWRDALGGWGAAVLRGDTTSARRSLATANALGAALVTRDGDRTLSEAVRAIRSVRTNRAARRRLATAHRAYAAGSMLYDSLAYARAYSSFALAASNAGDSPPLRAWAQLFVGASLLYLGRTAAATRTLSAVITGADTVREAALVGRARWVRGTVSLHDGRYEAALRDYRAASILFARAGERENLGAMQALAADASFKLGDWESGFSFAHQAFRTLGSYGRSVWLHNVLLVSADAAADGGLARAALLLGAEDTTLAIRLSATYAVESRLHQSRMLVATGDTARGRGELSAARRGIAALPASFARDWFAADARVTEASGPLRGAPRSAARALDSAVIEFSGLHNTLRLLPALLARSDAKLSYGDLRGGRADLDRATAILGAERDAITSATLRTSLLASVRSVFDHEVMLSAAAGNADEALSYMERARASLAPHAGHEAQTLSRGLGTIANGAAVEYALIGDTLLTWSVSRGPTQLVRATMDRAALAVTIERTRTALESHADDSTVRPLLASLYAQLIQPIAPRLSDGAPLIIVTDRELTDVPFAALYDARRKRFLIEDHALRFLPRLSEARRLETPDVAGSHTTLIGDPAFDADRFPTLGRLHGAAAELAAVGRLYPGARELTGVAATTRSVEGALQSASLIHYAGHALFDDQHPEQSFLLLAPTPGVDDGKLTASRIAAMDLSHVQLVVLSACETIRRSADFSSGFASLTDAFLIAGARGVIGTQWHVDDDLSLPVMTEFHRSLRRGSSASVALRDAQLHALHSADVALRSPGAWAGFRFVGM